MCIMQRYQERISPGKCHEQHYRLNTGWQRPIGCLKLQVIFRKRATDFRALLRKMTYKDKASYGSSPLYHDLYPLNTAWSPWKSWYDSFHSKFYIPEIHQIEKFGIFGILRYKFKLRFCFDLMLYRGIRISRSSEFALQGVTISVENVIRLVPKWHLELM